MILHYGSFLFALLNDPLEIKLLVLKAHQG